MKIEFIQSTADELCYYSFMEDGQYNIYIGTYTTHIQVIKGNGHKIHELYQIQSKDPIVLQAICQFIEDNYKTLTLEQLDNIEEVYLRSKK